MHRYESPERKSEEATSGDKRSGSKRLFDSSIARFLRMFSIVLGVYAPIGILLALVVLFAGVSGGRQDEDQARSFRRQMGVAAAGIAVSGVVAGYGSHRTWGIASLT